MYRLLICACLLATACGPSEPPAPTEPPVPAQAAPPEPPPPAQDAPAVAVNYRALVPSPLGIERSVREAGVAESLDALVPDRVFAPGEDEPNITAVRSGVVLADAILAGKDAPTAKLLERVTAVRAGMAAIGTGEGLLSTIDDLKVSIEQEGAGKQEFIQALDDVASMMVPEEGWGPDDTTGPLLQAGAWLEGSHLVAKAVVASGDASKAKLLLGEQEVVDYFLRYVRAEAAGKTDADIVSTLEQVLTTISELAAKPELGLEDVRVIEAQTGQALSLL